MEERWFQIGNNRPVAEGDMTLQVARLLKRSSNVGELPFSSRATAANPRSLRL